MISWQKHNKYFVVDEDGTVLRAKRQNGVMIILNSRRQKEWFLNKIKSESPRLLK